MALALSFRGDYGVLHQLSAADQVLLLSGDGVIAADKTVFVPMLDDIDGAPFSGAFALSAEHVCEAVREFLRHRSAEDLGDWQER